MTKNTVPIGEKSNLTLEGEVGYSEQSPSKKHLTRENCRVAIENKLALTIREAAEYSNIGINKIDQMLRAPNCPFVLFVGVKKLVKRKEFEEYISSQLQI